MGPWRSQSVLKLYIYIYIYISLIIISETTKQAYHKMTKIYKPKKKTSKNACIDMGWKAIGHVHVVC